MFTKFKKLIYKDPKLTGCILLIFSIAIFFRVFNYLDRIYVYADNALFVSAAYYAFDNLKLPQIGPFAQAPFFTGPWWLWILGFLYIFPFGVLTPWYFMTVLSLFFVLMIFFVGNEIGGKKLGLLAAFFASISTAQIDNSFMTWNAAADPLLGLLAVFFFLKFRKSGHFFYMFLLGFTVSLAITIHFQTFFFAPLSLIALLTTKPKIKNILALFVGGAIPMLPFLYFDLRFNWFETRRILDYMLIGQYRIYVPNRWLTYAGIFWPQSWSWIIGGKMWVGYLLIGLVSIVSVIKFRYVKKHLNYYLIAIAFLISVVLLRYYRGERFFYYSNYAHVFVLLLSAWALLEIYTYKKIVGMVLAIIVIFFSVQASIDNFKPRVITYGQVTAFVDEIYKSYPNKKIDIYECPFQASMLSTPASYKMYYDGKNQVGGIKIGVCNENLKLSWREVKDNEVDRPYTYLNKSAEKIYTDMTEWFIKNPPLTLW